jgi:hypothetical protein
MSLEERSKTQIRRKLRNPPKPKRRLRVYALDPSIGKRLASIAVNETVLQVEWEEGPQARTGRRISGSCRRRSCHQ